MRALEFHEDFRVLGAEAVEDVGIDHDHEIALMGALLDDSIELALNLDGHAHGGFHAATTCAVRAGFIHGVAQRFVEALAGHFHQTDGGDLQHLGLGLVFLDAVLHGLVDGHLVFAVAHVDEVNDDESADVAQTELACYGLGGLDVGLEDHFFLIFVAAIASGVDVDRNKGLGFIDDDVAATGEPDLARKGFVDLFLDADSLEERDGTRHVVDAAFGAA